MMRCVLMICLFDMIVARLVTEGYQPAVNMKTEEKGKGKVVWIVWVR